jgi:RNase P/RNase MRP subunit POP5
MRIVSGNRESVERALLQGLGTLGWAHAAPLFVHADTKEMRDIILSVDRRTLDDVRAALELAPEPLKVARVSGTLKGLTKSK